MATPDGSDLQPQLIDKLRFDAHSALAMLAARKGDLVDYTWVTSARDPLAGERQQCAPLDAKTSLAPKMEDSQHAAFMKALNSIWEISGQVFLLPRPIGTKARNGKLAYGKKEALTRAEGCQHSFRTHARSPP